MNIQTKHISKIIKRSAAFVAALTILVSSTSSVVLAAVAGGQVQYRSVKMSDNGASGQGITTGVGSGTNVSYRVTFRAASSYTIRGIVLDFCNGANGATGTPFIGDAACPALTDFSVGTTPSIDTSDYTYGNPSVTVTGLGTTGSWTPTSAYSGQTFKMSNSTGVALTAGNDYTFVVNGVTNMSDIGTFYSRLITYSTATGDIDTYDHGDAGNYQDYGGFALSTAQIVQVTAKVQETLTFCVSGTLDTITPYPSTTLVPPDTCASTAPPAIILGHGDNQTLDPSAIDRNTVWTLTSTNALRGVAIRMHNSNSCGGLSTDSGVTCDIPAVGPGTSAAITAGTAMFGMFCYDSDAGPLGANVCSWFGSL